MYLERHSRKIRLNRRRWPPIEQSGGRIFSALFGKRDSTTPTDLGPPPPLPTQPDKPAEPKIKKPPDLGPPGDGDEGDDDDDEEDDCGDA